MKMTIRALFIAMLNAVLFLFAANSFADGNVYRCKGVDGNVIFQQKACNDDQILGDDKQHRAWRKLRVMTADGIDVFSRLGADVESIKACKEEFKAYRKQLDDMAPLMSTLIYTHPHLAKSYGYLYECATCRTSAESFCHSSNRSLDEAMKTLVEF